MRADAERMNAAPDSRGTCLRVDLEAIAHNARVLKRRVGENVRMLAVVKANAYGHGLIPVAQTALENGASFLGVAVPEEGRRLREAGIDAPVLVLGSVTEEGARISVREELTQTVYDAAGVEKLQCACEEQNARVDVHLKLDTGMNRIGARTAQEVQAVLCALAAAPRVQLRGAFTHFCDADNADDSFSRLQFARFEELAALLPEGLLLHAAASDASLRFPWARLQMVREGISLYGCAEGVDELDLRPAMRFETRVACVKEIAAGDTVGYGRAFTAPTALRVATIPVGYGDGYPRACSGRASVLIGGELCPVLGRVCMDQMMVDVSRAGNVRPGDEAVLMGRQGEKEISAAQLGEWADTISYEILLSPHARVPVIYERHSERA
ncbi:MAG: alanine racemase [Clostridia bacterium]|nr:alanine racemase [Clostridia bacterium]